MEEISSLIYNKSITRLNLPTLGWVDILDIAIVAYIIFKLIMWLKDTRAWALFKGLFIVLIFMAVASFLQLNTILWILDNTLSVGVIAIIILFQPEFRKALEKLGRNRFILKFGMIDTVRGGMKAFTRTIDEVIKACEVMSKAKTGALIVIEREVHLGDHERTGIPIDALVSRQLILNIFEKNTPLHDGAVIIKNNRVSAATCFLPITESEISMDLGTRHRAAMGVSEVSDAFVIVVSEETGNISLCKEGVLYRNITGDTLRNMLLESEKVARKKLNKSGGGLDE